MYAGYSSTGLAIMPPTLLFEEGQKFCLDEYRHTQ